MAKLGILGDGQLARMLALKAQQMGISVRVFGQDETGPCAQVVHEFHKGSWTDTPVLKKFLSDLDFVTFESEFADVTAIKSALMDLSPGATPRVFPSLDNISLFQDRLTQKNELVENKIPTSPFVAVASPEELVYAINKLDLPLVLKKRQGGYDGYGTFVLKTNNDVVQFMDKADFNQHKFIAEKWQEFSREVAGLIARNDAGDFCSFPLVETLQKNSKCNWVRGPLKSKAWETLEKKIKKMLLKNDYVGAMGVEMFESKKGLIVNELAPRVHNTAHYSMLSHHVDQFEAHLRGGLNLSLQTESSASASFMMLNLLGPAEKKSGPELAEYVDELRQEVSGIAKTQFHWYGKLEGRPGRKMGHINFIGSASGADFKKLWRIRDKYKFS